MPKRQSDRSSLAAARPLHRSLKESSCKKQKIRIRLKAFDYKLIDQSALEIVEP